VQPCTPGLRCHDERSAARPVGSHSVRARGDRAGDEQSGSTSTASSSSSSRRGEAHLGGIHSRLQGPHPRRSRRTGQHIRLERGLCARAEFSAGRGTATIPQRTDDLQAANVVSHVAPESAGSSHAQTAVAQGSARIRGPLAGAFQPAVYGALRAQDGPWSATAKGPGLGRRSAWIPERTVEVIRQDHCLGLRRQTREVARSHAKAGGGPPHWVACEVPGTIQYCTVRFHFCFVMSPIFCRVRC